MAEPELLHLLPLSPTLALEILDPRQSSYVNGALGAEGTALTPGVLAPKRRIWREGKRVNRGWVLNMFLI